MMPRRENCRSLDGEVWFGTPATAAATSPCSTAAGRPAARLPEMVRRHPGPLRRARPAARRPRRGTARPASGGPRAKLPRLIRVDGDPGFGVYVNWSTPQNVSGCNRYGRANHPGKCWSRVRARATERRVPLWKKLNRPPGRNTGAATLSTNVVKSASAWSSGGQVSYMIASTLDAGRSNSCHGCTSTVAEPIRRFSDLPDVFSAATGSDWTVARNGSLGRSRSDDERFDRILALRPVFAALLAQLTRALRREPALQVLSGRSDAARTAGAASVIAQAMGATPGSEDDWISYLAWLVDQHRYVRTAGVVRNTTVQLPLNEVFVGLRARRDRHPGDRARAWFEHEQQKLAAACWSSSRRPTSTPVCWQRCWTRPRLGQRRSENSPSRVLSLRAAATSTSAGSISACPSTRP